MGRTATVDPRRPVDMDRAVPDSAVSGRAVSGRAVSGRAVPDRAALTRAVPDRAALARAVLARAEERTGAGHRVPLHVARPAGPVAAPGQTVPAVQRALPAHVPERTMPVSPGLAGLLPTGALERGSTVVVAGSIALVLALLAQTSREGSWVALVGLPQVGVLAAHQVGLDLDRVVLVPDPGPDGPRAVAALLDGVDVVVVGPRTALGHGDRRRLSARARERSVVLMSTGPWPGAQTVLTAGASRWEGLGRGSGRLRSRRLTVLRGGRGAAAREKVVEVLLHGSVGAFVSDSVDAHAAGSREPGPVGGRRAG